MIDGGVSGTYVNHFNEKVFLKLYKTHPEKAFKMLMDEFRDMVFLFVRRVAKTDMDAEDAAQEVFIRTWKGLASFRGDSSLTTWIYRIAWNVSASYLGKVGRSMEMVTYSENDSDNEGQITFSVAKSDAGFSHFESRQFLESLFYQIPASHRLVLTLYYLQELSYNEISDITGWPMGTVKATLHRAKAKMRQVASADNAMLVKPTGTLDE